MLPYFISLLILGIPLCWAEWTMGRYGGTRGFNSSPGIFSVIWRNRLSKYFGGVALLIPLIIYMYYVLIEAWCLGYAINYVTGDLTIGTGGHVDQLVAQVPDEYAKSLVETLHDLLSNTVAPSLGKAAKSIGSCSSLSKVLLPPKRRTRIWILDSHFNKGKLLLLTCTIWINTLGSCRGVPMDTKKATRPER